MTVDDAPDRRGSVRHAGPPTARRTRRRRRPTGAPPPLPRSIGTSGTAWLVAAAVLLVLSVIADVVRGRARRRVNQVDSAILRQFAGLRTEWLTDVADAIDRVGSGWIDQRDRVRTARRAASCCERWRHLFTFIGATFVIEIIADVLYRWSTPTAPVRRDDHRPVGRLVVLRRRRSRWSRCSASRISYTLVATGRGRQIAKAVTAVAVVVFACSRALPGDVPPVRHASSASRSRSRSSSTRSASSPPTRSSRSSTAQGKTAHLDVGGRRGEAIRHAVQDQLGLTVVEIEPFGLAGSGGSTPLRIRVAGDPDTYLFGKLYAMSHVRADRWYKLGRTLLYGRLEDEAPFQSVARLVEYEDYMLRVMRDAGVPTAEPYGIVELTPAREYLLVTEFFDDAHRDR